METYCLTVEYLNKTYGQHPELKYCSIFATFFLWLILCETVWQCIKCVNGIIPLDIAPQLDNKIIPWDTEFLNIQKRFSIQTSSAKYCCQGQTRNNWINDNEAKICMCCKITRFTWINRRHHCRKCCKVVCQNCSTRKHVIPYKFNKPVRVCDFCYESLSASNTMPNKSGPDSPLNTTTEKISDPPKLDDKLLTELSSQLGKDRVKIGIYLGLSYPEIQNCESNNPCNSEGQALEMLTRWRNNSMKENQLDQLKEAFEMAKRKDLVQIITPRNSGLYTSQAMSVNIIAKYCSVE